MENEIQDQVQGQKEAGSNTNDMPSELKFQKGSMGKSPLKADKESYQEDESADDESADEESDEELA